MRGCPKETEPIFLVSLIFIQKKPSFPFKFPSTGNNTSLFKTFDGWQHLLRRFSFTSATSETHFLFTSFFIWGNKIIAGGKKCYPPCVNFSKCENVCKFPWSQGILNYCEENINIIIHSRSASTSYLSAEERCKVLQNSLSLRNLYEEMCRPTTGIPLRSHRYRLRTYSDCFLGSELVDWLIYQQKANTRFVVHQLN